MKRLCAIFLLVQVLFLLGGNAQSAAHSLYRPGDITETAHEASQSGTYLIFRAMPSDHGHEAHLQEGFNLAEEEEDSQEKHQIRYRHIATLCVALFAGNHLSDRDKNLSFYHHINTSTSNRRYKILEVFRL